jgi:alpha-L-fucosidase
MESWGYKKDEDYYTDRHLMSSIDKYLARDANYLLNVGPTGEGLIPTEAVAILKRIGRWKKAVGESYVSVKPDTELVSTAGVLVTKRDKTVYIHLNRLPVGNGIKLKPVTIAPVKATMLNSGEKVDFAVNLCPSDHTEQQPYLRLRNLPLNEMENTIPVVKLEFGRPLEEIIQKSDAEINIELTK